MEYMRKFLETNYSDEQLMALIEDLPCLSYHSCCCFVGRVTGDHPREAAADYTDDPGIHSPHLSHARELPFAKGAEAEFALLVERPDWRLLVWFLIQEEISRRALERQAGIAHEGDLVTA